MAKKFLVDIYVPYVKSVVVEAKTAEEAEQIVREGYGNGDFDPRDFNKTDDSEEIKTYGQVCDDLPSPWPLYTPKKK